MSDQPPHDAQYRVALDNCASEPIHIPGRVQAFAAVVAIDTETDLVSHVSENFQELTGLPQLKVGQQFFTNFNNRELNHEIRGALGLPTISRQRESLGQFLFDGLEIDVAVHRTGKATILEMERDARPTERITDAVSQVRSMMGHIHATGRVDTMLEKAVYSLRHTTGFDRVMAYRFLPGFEGEVVAEQCSPGLSPYLGLRYPASDIPPQVRDSMLKMPFRCIADIDEPESAVLADHNAPALDLTLTHCKGVSPIHGEYLRNMGVRSTLNIPIVCDGELWGLFAFHHRRPKLLPPTLRTVCELFGYFFSMEMQQCLQSELLSRRRQASSLIDHLGKDEFAGQQVCEAVSQISNDLVDLLDADGVALLDGEEYTPHGFVADHQTAKELLLISDDDLFTFDNLGETISRTVFDPDGQIISGVLVAILDRTRSLALLFFRNEEIAKVRWAGEPAKRIEFGPNGPRLHPRASFDEYVESVRGRSRPWQEKQVAAASELRGALLTLLFRESSLSNQHWLREKKRQDLLIAELNHRVKNTLALVRAIARQTTSSANSLEQYTLSFERRISALATAHDLIGGNGLQWAPLQTILLTELRPYNDRDSRCQVSGPTVSVKSDVAPVLSLVVHELATNAAKHGALSGDSGNLEVRWRAQNGGLELRWLESLRHELAAPTSTGFGLSLIQRAIPHECAGETDVEFSKDGVLVRIWLPSKAVRFSSTSLEQDLIATARSPEPRKYDAKGLIVEDSMIVAMDIKEALVEWGCRSVDTVGSKQDALELVHAHRYEFALLDINLGQSNSYPVAEALQKQGVPFIFVSGYGDRHSVPDSMASVPILGKPLNREELAENLGNLLKGREAS